MKNKILLPILLLATMTMVACNSGSKESSKNPDPTSSDVQPTTSDEQPTTSEEQPVSSEDPQSSSDPVTYGVAINNKSQLTGEWYKGTTRDLDITLTPAANALQEIQKGNLVITSSNPEIVAITGLGMNALDKGKATITVKYHDAVDTVDVDILSNSAKDKYGTAHEGTAEDPFTNEDALLVAKSEKYEKEVYYVKGKVASFYNAPGSRDDGMVAYFLEPATEGGEKFEIYKCFKADGGKLTDDDIWVGGEATAYGSFTKYNAQYETSSAVFVSCTGTKPEARKTVEKTFAEVLAGGVAFADGADSYDYWKFQGYVTKRDGNNFWLTASKGETLVSGKSDEAHGNRDIYTNGIELYNAGKVEALVAKLLENAKVEVTMIVKNYHGTVENGNNLADADVTVIEAGTAWSVPEPAVANRTLKEFIDGENTKAKAYNVTATIKAFKDGETKAQFGDMTLTDGTNELVIYGATATASALAWDNSSAYSFTNPKDFLTNEVTAALKVGDSITMKLIRSDYTKDGVTTIQGVGIVLSSTNSGGGEGGEGGGSEDTTNYGTETEPLTVAQAKAIATAQLGEVNSYTESMLWVKAYVTNVPTVNGTYGWKNIYLGDAVDAAQADTLLAYSVNKSDTCAKLAQNDFVLIHGALKNYNGTIEFTNVKDGDTTIHGYPTFSGRVAGTSTITLGAHENATVSELPASAKNDTAISFTVTPASGYVVTFVKVNNNIIVANEGSYSFDLAGNSEIVVETAEEGAVTPTANVEKATSVAVGDTLILSVDNSSVKKQLTGISDTSTKYGLAEDYSSVPDAAKAPLTVVAGSAANTFALKLGDAYLAWTSGNSLITVSSVDASSSWSITFTDGVPAIVNSSEATRKLQYNAGNPRFATYTSAQTAVTLWKVLPTAGE